MTKRYSPSPDVIPTLATFYFSLRMKQGAHSAVGALSAENSASEICVLSIQNLRTKPLFLSLVTMNQQLRSLPFPASYDAN
jgi:hypothetical protein